MSNPSWLTKDLISTLKSKFEGTHERVGFVLNDGSLVEVPNISAVPEDSFDVSDADLDKYIDDAAATWHTHPGQSSQLSIGDYETYRELIGMTHFIVGTDGVSAYIVDRDAVLNLELPE